MINPDFDPLQTLEDLARQQLETAQIIRALVEYHNQLNHRLSLVEFQINQDSSTS